MPNTPNTFLFVFGPFISMTMALWTSAVIRFGYMLDMVGSELGLQASDIDDAMLFVCAVLSVSVYGIMIGGWASNNKYSLISAMRVASQMISYEIAMGLSIVAILMMHSSMSLREIAAGQHEMHWNIFYQPLGFFIFL